MFSWCVGSGVGSGVSGRRGSWALLSTRGSRGGVEVCEEEPGWAGV